MAALSIKDSTLESWSFDFTLKNFERYGNILIAISTFQRIYLYQGSGGFWHAKLIAPLILTGRGLLPLGKANCGGGYRERAGCGRSWQKNPNALPERSLEKSLTIPININ
jgi:hypothetical protein